MIAPHPAAQPRDAALRALRDCRVIRLRIAAVPRGFQMLQREGAISARRAPVDGYVDCRLTETGTVLAEVLPLTKGGSKIW